MRDLLEVVLRESGVNDVADYVRQQREQPSTLLAPISLPSSSTTHTPIVGLPSYAWGGTYHRLPKDFKLPKINAKTAFQQWYLGSETDHLPALRYVDHTDFSLPNSKKRFSELSALMKILEECLETDESLIQDPTLAQVNIMFDKACTSLGLFVDNPSRFDTLSWRTVFNNYRSKHPESIRHKRRKKSSHDEESESEDED